VFADDQPCARGKRWKAENSHYSEPNEENRYADEHNRHPRRELKTELGSRPVQSLIDRQRFSPSDGVHGGLHRLPGERANPASTPAQNAGAKERAKEPGNGILKTAAHHADSGED
jgi:hypothetical protein